SLAGKDAFLNDRFFVRAFMFGTATGGVFSFGVFAYDDDVYFVRGTVCQGRPYAGHQPYGPDVGILMKFAADGDEQTPKRNVVRDARITNGAQKDGIEIA